MPKSRKTLRPCAYDRDQHHLVCQALNISPDPKAPGDTALEAVCELQTKITFALNAKTLQEAKKILRTPQGKMPFIQIS
jgi:hypothetical protein